MSAGKSPEPPPSAVDLAVIGGGILGLATAREFLRRHPGVRTVVFERKPEVGTQQTARNSGVIHAGIYYAPGSLKARACVEGARAMYEYCAEHGIPHKRCGKLIVARAEYELAWLDELERRGRENGVPGLLRVGSHELREIEPHCRGVAALHSPETGIVDFAVVARTLATNLIESGVQVFTSCGVERVAQRQRGIGLLHRHGQTRARVAIFCAGGCSDRLAVAAGGSPDPRIVPFRGAYVYLRPERRSLVRSLIYPVPDRALPFLGVHLSRHIDGQVSVGPTALLWPRGPTDLTWPGTWRMLRRWWRTGLTEIHHAVSRRALATAASAYVPEIRPEDFAGGFAGVRAQALARDGALIDDFVFSETERALHIRNAPSPAATSAFALARLIANRVDSLAAA